MGAVKTVALLNRSYSSVVSKANELELLAEKRGPRPLPNHQAAKNSLYHMYKKEAEKRELFFDLPKDNFEKLIIDKCYYCGNFPYTMCTACKIPGFYYNGIDRVDNSKGYTINNCVTCCKKCNYMKASLTTEDFIDHIRKILFHIESEV